MAKHSACSRRSAQPTRHSQSPTTPRRQCLGAGWRLALLAGLLLLGGDLRYAMAESYGPYQATLVRVLDGDTVRIRVHIWPGLEQEISVRLDGVDTPEYRGSSACEKAKSQEATSFTREFLSHDTWVTLSKVRLGKYAGRVLGRLSVNGTDLSSELIRVQLGRSYSGGKRQPWCVARK